MAMTSLRTYDEVDISSFAFWSQLARDRDRAYEELRRERPVSWHRPVEDAAGQRANEDGFWAVVRHRDVHEVYRRHEDFCSGQGIFFEDLPSVINEHLSFIALDPPRHTKLRRLVSVAFTPRAVADLEPKLRRRAASIVEDLVSAGPGDFVEHVATRLPLWTICEMVGVPEDQRGVLADLVDDMTNMNDSSFAEKYPGVEPAMFMVQGLHRLAEIGRQLAAERRRRPRADLMTGLVEAEVDGERLTDEEIGYFFNLLITAGYDTTVHTMSVGLHGLRQAEGQWDLLRSDLAAHLPGAIEEMIRWTSVGLNFRRTATRDTEIAGVPIRAGDKVVMFLLSANRDETAFGDPWRFDLTRNPNPHIAFGKGIHYCLGSALARLELSVLLRELVTRVPQLEITDVDFAVGNHMQTVKRLQVTF